jgi:intraflagellar transport protein 52
MICPILLEAIMKEEQENFTVLYPNGCSLNVSKPSLPIISSGATSYPVNRPLGAIYQSPISTGKLIVFGAGHAFTEK